MANFSSLVATRKARKKKKAAAAPAKRRERAADAAAAKPVALHVRDGGVPGKEGGSAVAVRTRAPLDCKDNKRQLRSTVANNIDFDFSKQEPKYLINYEATDPGKIVALGLEYVRLLTTSLCKLVVFCNRSKEEQLDAKLTIKYAACAERNGGAPPEEMWVVRYNLPGTTHAATTERKYLSFSSLPKLRDFIFSNGHVNLVELHSKGVKVSDDYEKMTMYYIVD